MAARRRFAGRAAADAFDVGLPALARGGEFAGEGWVCAGYTQPAPATCPSAPTVPGVMSVNVGQSATVCGVGPWPLISAISFASAPPATA